MGFPWVFPTPSKHFNILIYPGTHCCLTCSVKNDFNFSPLHGCVDFNK